MGGLNFLIRFALFLGVGCTLVAAVVSLGPGGVGGSLFDPFGRYGEATDRRQVLLKQLDETRSRLERRDRVMQALLERRLTLLEAAAWFHELLGEIEELCPTARLPYPNLSPEERACLLVLVRLCDHPADDPVASIQLIAELGAELQDLGPCSPIRLPPPPPLADESGAALD
jgi:hypothetical protein